MLDLDLPLEVNPDQWRSKVRLTPYRGKRFIGAPVATMVAGALVFDALSEPPHE
ncbi:MAG: Dihydroorotase [Synergistetes bacterium ADurb.Bin520]|nr:MAG: Dihydroorotase [Synergistetes bacterium ADurb.Bin520]